ncbi:hypothetical protein [Longimicrobium terrae]|uniref:Uncharacterized protein n=1 Tax=Longimicrobium terrae TaxID=1639882 RepID=A0A841GUE9_9BACT|nr:hypothetical protein [Longimicrobium terrae]MBB4635993.1 hypothetical protein [Longimicrobium terrae]MBB6070389.1 hypothetical protein [Longimicrobium terrae]NNC30885.1 hypothetical protein [Longimicrobium terrae]
MNWLPRTTERALLALALAGAAGCIDQGALFGPDPETHDGAPRVRLPAARYTLFEGDRVALRLEALEGDARAELLVLDAAREVVWRSGAVQAADTVVEVPVGALPPRLLADTTLSLTAAVDAGGTRVWATDDTAAVLSRERAALRPVRFHAGRVVALDADRPRSFALDPIGGRLYFAAPGRAVIGVVDLASGREEDGTAVPSGPVALRFHYGRLGALISGGTELAVFRAAPALTLAHRVLLPTLVLDIQTPRPAAEGDTPAQVDTLRATVRPYAAGLAWGCPDGECESPLAFASSGLAGTDPAAAGAVLRRVPLAATPAAPLVIPVFQPGWAAEDTAPSRVWIFAAASSGGDSLVHLTEDGLGCATTVLGHGVFDLSPARPGVLYAASADESACGDGTRLTRVDDAASARPRLSALARRNQLGEDRIGRVLELRVSPDGALVLVRTADAVQVLDADLRLRGTVEVPGASAIAWVEGPEPGSDHFAVASDRGVVLYDTARRREAARFPLGSTGEGLLVVWRTGGELVAAAAPRDRDGLVSARIPAP